MKQQLQGRVVPGLMIVGLAALMCGCSGSAPKAISDPDPALKIPAMRAAADSHDLKDSKQLVKDLESDDSAVRFYAIGTLERLTGQTYGYQYFMDEEKRAAAIEKWKAWLAGWEAGQRESAGK